MSNDYPNVKLKKYMGLISEEIDGINEFRRYFDSHRMLHLNVEVDR